MDLKQRMEINTMLKEELKDRKISLNFCKVMTELKKKDFPKCVYSGKSIYIYINEYKELRKIRGHLRKCLGTWKDKLSLVSGHWATAKEDFLISYYWEGHYKGVEINIKLQLYKKEIPEQLLHIKKGCGFVEDEQLIQSSIGKTISYTCGLKK